MLSDVEVLVDLVRKCTENGIVDISIGRNHLLRTIMWTLIISHQNPRLLLHLSQVFTTKDKIVHNVLMILEQEDVFECIPNHRNIQS